MKAVIRPLDGVTVISLEHAIAAPFCTRQLADMGARVIKVERPGVGDFARKYDERTRGMASHFVWTNRSKESLTLDLKHPQAAPILEELLGQADVLVQNLAPGAAARMGLSFEALHARFPKLIVCDISGYGEGGPYETKKAYDLLIQSESGFVSVTGSPDAPAKAGSLTSPRPSSRCTASIVAGLSPKPPNCSGTIKPATPNSTKLLQAPRSSTPTRWRARRSAYVQRSVMRRRKLSVSMRCSSEYAKSIFIP